MTKRMLLGLMLALMLPAAAGIAAASDEDTRERNWALGWDDALVLRRQLGLWHLGVSAGPNDVLSDENRQVWIVSEPDSLQGRSGDERSDRRESGFVALEVGRRVAVYENFSLAATSALRYGWSDSRTEYSWPRDPTEAQPSRQEVRDWFEDSWTLKLGARVSWRPVPFIGLEAGFGLAYRWTDVQETRWDRDSGQWDWDRADVQRHSQSFTSYGVYNLTDLAILVWF